MKPKEKNMDGLKVDSIKLKAKSGASVELTIDEARELFSQLKDLFGKSDSPMFPTIIYRDRWVKNEPYWYSPIWTSHPTTAGNAAAWGDSKSVMLMCHASGDSVPTSAANPA